MKFREPRTGAIVEQDDPKLQRILEQGGYERVVEPASKSAPKAVAVETPPTKAKSK